MSTISHSTNPFDETYEHVQPGAESISLINTSDGASVRDNSQPLVASSDNHTSPNDVNTNLQHNTPFQTTQQLDSYRTDIESGKTDTYSKPPEIIVTQQLSEDDFLAKTPTTPSRRPSTDGALSGAAMSNTTTRSSGSDGKRVPFRDSAWPTRRELQEKALLTKRERMRRNWNCLGGFTHRQRVFIRILAALLIIGAAVGIGVGISVAVHGGVFKSNGQQSHIPQ